MSRTFIYIIAILASIGGLLFGYDTGAISGALLFITNDFSLSIFEQEVIVAVLLLFAAATAPFAGIFADRYGRRPVILTAAGLFILASLIMATAPDFRMLVAGRALVGIAIGLSSMSVPLYVSEMAPPKVRGLCVSLNQLMITIGILLGYGVDLYFSATGNWRIMLGFAVLPAAMLFLAMLFLPETPRWLLSKGKKQKAMALFHKIGIASQEIDKAVQAITKTRASWTAEYRKLLDPSLRAPLIAGAMLAVLQQVTGINTIVYYAPTLFSSVGSESAYASILATVGIGTVNVVMTVISIFLIDRIGRRPLLLTGTTMMAASLAVLGLSNFFPLDKSALAWSYNISLFVYIAGFAIGLGPVAWLFISEAYPQDVRGVAMSVATFANWASNCIVALTFLTILHTLGAGITFLLYAAIGAFTVLFIYYKIPETKGKTLEEIQRFWRKS